MLHAFCCAYDVCIYDFWFFIWFIKLWGIGFEILKCFCPFSHIHLSKTLCTQSHRVAVAFGHRKIYLGEASSQLSWDKNLRMGSWNTSTQIEPFPFVACNGWGSGCPTSPTRTTVGINLGAFRSSIPKVGIVNPSQL